MMRPRLLRTIIDGVPVGYARLPGPHGRGGYNVYIFFEPGQATHSSYWMEGNWRDVRRKIRQVIEEHAHDAGRI
jgi:hypothetical protein